MRVQSVPTSLVLRRHKRRNSHRAWPWRRVFRRTIAIVFKVLRNVTAGAALSSLFALLAAHGNAFVSLKSQMLVEFVTANNAWFILLFSCITVVHLGTTLMDETFKAQPQLSRSKRFLLCFGKLGWRLSPHIVSAGGAATFAAYFLAKAIPAYKLGMYFTCISACYITIWADVHARHLFRNETERGRQSNNREQKQKQTTPRTLKIFDALQPSLTSTESNRRLQSHRGISWQFVKRIAILNVPLVISALISIIYVHAITLVLDISKQWHFVAFTACSMATKVLLQEVIKRAMLKQERCPSRRLVMVVIATPTILIETQVRIFQLRLGSNAIKVMSVLSLAVIEIAIRALKLLAVQRQFGDRVLSATSQVLSSSSRRLSHSLKLRKQLSYSGPKVGPSELTIPELAKSKGSVTSIATYQVKLLMLHTAETYADMYAEYIALGCSYAMFVCFSEHPFFSFNAGPEDTSYSRGA